jgi:hypothetical protein
VNSKNKKDHIQLQTMVLHTEMHKEEHRVGCKLRAQSLSEALSVGRGGNTIKSHAIVVSLVDDRHVFGIISDQAVL